MPKFAELDEQSPNQTARPVIFDKNSLFQGKPLSQCDLGVKEKGTTTYMVSGWIAVLRLVQKQA
jgi:hypothetical protein